MSWGTELWDQWDNIGHHTQKGLDFCDRYVHFLKERTAVELDYASKLKKLVKNYQPKKREDDESTFTWSKSFQDMLKEVYDMASQHEVVAENLSGTVSKNLHDFITDVKVERKRHLQDGYKLQEHLKISSSTLDKAKRKYEKAHYDSERSLDNYRKADADINLSRAEVEKHRVVMNGKVSQCEESKNEYASQLQTHNNHQNNFYSQAMPQIFQSIQDMDEKRISKLQECVTQCADIEKNVVPIINTCIEGISKAAGNINIDTDSKLVIDRYKSGFPIPEDVPFEDLSTGQSIEPSNNGGTPQRIPKDPKTVSGTMSGKTKKRTGIFGIFGSSKTDEPKEDFSDLPPNQRRRKLQLKIEAIKKEMSKEQSEREGILKLKDVYAGNPALGDAGTLEKKIEENGRTLDGLRQELMKFEGYMGDAEGNGNGDKTSRRHSASEDSRSLSTSGSGDTPHPQQASNPGTPQVQHNNVYADGNDDDEDDDFDGIEPEPIDGDEDGEDEFDIFPVIGQCRALYPFEAVNEGSVAMGENEEMSILEQDQGDGWTRVRKTDGGEGFVPTSYVECHYYDADQV